MDSEHKFWVLIWLELGFFIAAVLVTLVFGVAASSIRTHQLETIQRENLIKNCTQVDVHVDQYGGVTSYACNVKKEAK